MSASSPYPATRRLHHQLQDRLATLIGVSPVDREARLAGLLRPRPGDAAGYWLQLAISVIIATFGLAQGSTAVVIGAMLIAPLMQPIVELGIGLGLGSPLLTFRGAGRFAGGLLLALAVSAGITQAMPFHELTPELAARTSPTMLDLLVAAACALAAVYTTVHSSGETASAAAGTAIGISLVPPLATAGWGLGTGSWEVARGAGLLFTANFTAIVVVTAGSVLLLGFGQHDVVALEKGELSAEDRETTAPVAARAAGRLLRGRLAVFARIALPLALLAAIYVPLRAALEQVAWQSSARADVQAALAPHADRLVRQSLEVRPGVIRLGLIAIGDREENEAMLALVRADVVRRTGVEPAIEAIHVPDDAALAALAATLPREVPLPSVAPPLRPPGPRLVATLDAELASLWPRAAGELLVRRLVTGSPATVELLHLGPPLGAPASELLAASLTDALGMPVTVTARGLPTEAVVATGDVAAWLTGALQAMAEVPAGVSVCLEVPAPPPPPRRGRPPAADPQRELTVATLTAAAGGHEHALTPGDRWSIRFTRGPCVPVAPAAPAAPAAPVTPAAP